MIAKTQLKKRATFVLMFSSVAKSTPRLKPHSISCFHDIVPWPDVVPAHAGVDRSGPADPRIHFHPVHLPGVAKHTALGLRAGSTPRWPSARATMGMCSRRTSLRPERG